MATLAHDAAARVIARSLRARGVDRVFALCGGHIMPLWMSLDDEGIAIVDVRDERAAVYMAHAYGELRGMPGPKALICYTEIGHGVRLIAERERAHFVRVGDGEWEQVRRELEETAP